MTLYRVNPGKYRTPVTIQKRNGDTDSYGAPSDDSDWTDVIHVRAGVFPLSGSEFFKANEINSEITHRVQMRYIPGITPDMRIVLNGRKLIITSVVNYQESNIELQLYCKELVK
jgi:SPP1 family predicted phage head-tail adaptor